MKAILAFFLLGLASLVHSLDQEQVAAINRIINEQFLPLNSIPGAGLAIVHGSDSLAQGYGYRNLEQDQLATSATYFAIGSISKSFTALIVLRVLTTHFPELGEQVLDVPIRELVPSYNFMSIDRYRSENMNMRDLLSHRACTLPENWGIFAGPYNSKEEFIYRQRYSESVCLTRTEFVYNNGLVQQAGEIAAAIAGTSFENLLNQLFQDIGMYQTTFVRENDDLEAMPMLAKPYYREDGVLKRMNTELLKPVAVAPGSGGILTTPAEFVRYMRFHLNGGRIGSDQIIPEEVMKWMHRLTNPSPGLSFKTGDSDFMYGDMGYGLCVFIGSYKGYQTIGHGGYLPPYLSLMTMLPAHNIGIFTTVSGPGSAHVVNMTHAAVHAQILNILVEGADTTTTVDPHLNTLAMETETSASPFKVSLSKAPVKMQIAPNENAPYALGIYGHPTSGTFNVTQYNETTLYISYGFAKAFLVESGTTNVYDPVWDSDFPQYFWSDNGFIPPVTFDFTDPLIAYLDVAGDRTAFHKDATLDTLPDQPWLPGSC